MDTNTGAATTAERNATLEKAFAEGEMKVGGFVLRPFSLGTLNFCKQMGLTAFTGALEGEEGAEAITAMQMVDQLVAFIWLQTEPLTEVKAAVRDGSWKKLVEDFGFNVEMDNLGQVLEEVERIAKLAEAAAVQVKPKPGTQEKGAPKN